MVRKLVFLAALILASRCAADVSVIKSWDFARNRSKMEWKASEDVSDFLATPQGLAGKTPGKDPKLVVTGLEIPAKATQYVEIEMRTDTAGEWQLFWANTTQGQYQGFQPQAVTNFYSRPGEFRTYRIFPFWQAMGKIVQLRLDPPDRVRSTFTIRAVKVVQVAASEASRREPSWSFRGTADGWIAASEAKGTPYESGWRAQLEARTALLLAPPVDFEARSRPWATVVMTAQGVNAAQIVWATPEKLGVRSKAFAVVADGKAHTYNVKLSPEDGWSGRIIAVGLSPTADPGSAIRLKSVTFSDSRRGPADVRLVRAWTDATLVRKGSSFKLRALFENAGGEPSPVTSATVKPEGGIACLAPTLTVRALKPGETAEKEWTLRATEAGTQSIRIVSGTKTDFRLCVQPELPKNLRGKMEYVPTPKPVSTGDYLVGCYYFPGWHTYGRWSVLDQFPERRPVLGYYREGDPEVADWQIKWAVEHGIGFWIYDWYWSAGERKLDHALHDGFFKARYRDMMKFCLLWANHNPPGSSSPEDMEAVTQYWIDNYFKRSEYLKIDGKPVVVIFSPGRFTEDMGRESTRKALEHSREMCRKAGLAGLYFVACTYPEKDAIWQMEQEGYDALSGYNYPPAGSNGNRVAPYADMVDAYPDYWKQIDEMASIPYIPVTEPGWDSRPWHGDKDRVRTGKTPQLFEKMLENARGFEDAPARRKLGGKKIVFIEAWNELGEGDYIEPHREWGFGYLDAIRQVFSDAKEPHTDLTPQDVGLGPYDLPQPPKITFWEFKKSNPGVISQNIRDFGVRDGTLQGVSINNDPGLYFPLSGIDASGIKTIEIRMSVSAGKNGQIFWTSGDAMSEEQSAHFPVSGDGRTRTYRVDMSGQKLWSGPVRTLRIDPTDAADAQITVNFVDLVSAERATK
ncbi:MAG: glycoside hydrolase family 99-like domain-containing protein [Armatimonadetes bacterium]|nr:glycoside hydrolase family 99-like domain-containing protein [Armatimonadota bacterium]